MAVRRLVGTVTSLVVVLTAASVALAATHGGSADPTPGQLRAIFARLHITPTLGDRAFTIPSSSMEPTLHCAKNGAECLAAVSDRVMARPYGTTRVQRGDLMAFRTPPLTRARCGAGGTFIKRVIVLPGEMFEERDGHVFVNGNRVAEPYVPANRRDARTIAPKRIPRDSYFVMGDNRVSSCDSRAWGTVPARNIIGHVLAIYWPAGRARRL